VAQQAVRQNAKVISAYLEGFWEAEVEGERDFAQNASCTKH